MEDTSICSYAAMRRATRRLGLLYDQATAPTGLKMTQLSLMFQIRRLQGPTLRALADVLVMDLSALGHTLKPLQRDGFVELNPDPKDRRAKRATLTSIGEAKLDEGLVLWRKVHERSEELLGAERSLELRKTLDWMAAGSFAEDFYAV